MKRVNLFIATLATTAIALSFAACSDDKTEDFSGPEAKYVGQAVGNFSSDEWYPGGQLGTTENIASNSYQDETPAVENMGLMDQFYIGEKIFEQPFNTAQKPYWGLGPAYVRSSCLDCHPNYGHGKRKETYKTAYGNGNGYLLVVYHPTDGANSNDGPYIPEVTGMPQTQATRPFKAPIDEDKVSITWESVTAMESGNPMQFPDGEKFSLIYPVVNIPRDAFNVKWKDDQPLAFRLESTIGIGGTGLLDAIPQDEIKAQYEKTAAYFKGAGLDVKEHVNPAFWDADKNDFAKDAWYKLNQGQMADGSKAPDASDDYPYGKMVKRFTYALTRCTLQDGPGANAVWNITNVSRPDRPNLYTTTWWAEKMAEDEDVIKKIKDGKIEPYWKENATDAEIAERVKGLLDPATNQFNNEWSGKTISPEMTSDQFWALMVWHRGLAIPRARNLNDPQVQRGKELFNQIGCVACHRPTWKTGSDNYWAPSMLLGKQLPQYPNQTIHPYTDMMQHKLYMKNDIHGSWCRTTPLWGRGLALINTGSEDRLHDCRARNEIEAIMWHMYSKKSHAYNAAHKFYELPKADRDAVVKFLRSI